MKRKKKDENFLLPIFILLGVLIVFSSWWSFTQRDEYRWEKCGKYTNTSDMQYMFGKCYVMVMNCWETREVCRGAFFTSCYESDEPRTRCHTSSRCIVAKTGEACR